MTAPDTCVENDSGDMSPHSKKLTRVASCDWHDCEKDGCDLECAGMTAPDTYVENDSGDMSPLSKKLTRVASCDCTIFK